MRTLSTLALLGLGCSEHTIIGTVLLDEDTASTEEQDAPLTDTGALEDTGSESEPYDPDKEPDPGEDLGACPIPVPDHVDMESVIWAETGVHFYVPEASWALSTALSWRMTEGLSEDGIDLRLRPSYFFATALKESFMGCSDDTEADPAHPYESWTRQVLSDYDGCFQLESTTAFTEICRLFPNAVDCEVVTHSDVISSLDQSSTGRDNFESGAMAATLYNTFAYAMLTNHGISDPDAWFADASDPQAMLKMIAIIYNRGAWSGEIDFALDGCQDQPLEECLSTDSIVQDYVKAVSSYAAELEAAVEAESCYDDAMGVEDIEALVDGLEPMLRYEDWTAIESAAIEAFYASSGGEESLNFQAAAGPVLDAIEDTMALQLECPAGQLNYWYGVSCPL
jgi:hypothetical protein